MLLDLENNFLGRPIFKKLGLIAAAVTLLAIITPVFLPTHFSMSRSIEIDVPIGVVFSSLTDLNIYVKWNPFPEGDSTNQTNITGSGMGAYLTWKGDKTGEGKMTLTSVDMNKKIDVKMEFYKPMSGEGMVYWITDAKSASVTELTWKFEQDLPYFNRYFGLMMDSMMGKHFEKGLSNFKTLVEAAK